MNDELREEALEMFRDETGLEALQALVQQGENPAVYSLDLGEGRLVRIGGIDVLSSHTALFRRLLELRIVLLDVKPKRWKELVGLLVAYALQYHEALDDSYEQTVLEWLRTYSQRASSDRDGAAPAGEPFIEDGDLYVAAVDVAKFVRREYSETVKLTELRQGLRDLGFEQRTVRYRVPARNGSETKSSSTSYYHAPLATLDAGDAD